jgi:hypothetical protein
MPPRFQWGEDDIYRAGKVTQDPNIGFGVSLKLREGVSVTQANAELQPVAEQLAKDRPAFFPTSFRVSLQSIVDVYALWPLPPP